MRKIIFELAARGFVIILLTGPLLVLFCLNTVMKSM